MTNGNHDAATEVTWPELPYAEWEQTAEFLHMVLQMVGKVKLLLCPFVNQWWEVALYASARGFTSGSIPWRDASFDMELDLVADRFVIRVSDGGYRELPLAANSVADFYRDLTEALESLGITVTISTLPSEVPEPVAFERNTTIIAYDGEYARRWWRVVLGTERVLNRFRTPFHGKASPIHLFWGGMDFNHTRFNGAPLEAEPGADRMMRYGEDEANFSAGFWPGNAQAPAAFYTYMKPAPAGIESATIEPDGAGWVAAMGEFMLPLDAVRATRDPDAALLRFYQSTYEAAANLAGWDRAALESDFSEVNPTP